MTPPMNPAEKYLALLRRARRIAAQLEALSCGYVTADHGPGGEDQAHAAVVEDIRALAGAVPPTAPRTGHG